MGVGWGCLWGPRKETAKGKEETAGFPRTVGPFGPLNHINIYS